MHIWDVNMPPIQTQLYDACVHFRSIMERIEHWMTDWIYSNRDVPSPCTVIKLTVTVMI